VPSVSVNKLQSHLKEFGVNNPDEEWGSYAFLRDWDEKQFLKSLAIAEATPLDKLNRDGNRAVMFSSTTDPYQVLRHPNHEVQMDLNARARAMMRRMLELIRDNSSLNVRILTRSPLARLDFDIFRSFGNRLLFGMSIPTLDDRLARVYEPTAPAPSLRLQTLKLARDHGIPLYVAMAPTYPEQGEEDLRAILEEISDLDPVTIFHEPINIRAENIVRMEKEADAQGMVFQREIFENRDRWISYAARQLLMVNINALELGLEGVIHSWPDPILGGKANRAKLGAAFSEWIDITWSTVSRWPTEGKMLQAA
jgi:DNA repair photolyase